MLFSYTPCHLSPEMGWVSCSFLISSPTLLPLILIKHSGSWELTPFPCNYNLLTSWPLSPEWPELLAQFSSSPQGLHHVHWAQFLHPFLHYLSYQFSATSWISPPKETMHHLWNVNWITSYSEHTSHPFKSQPPEQHPPHTHTILWPYPSIPTMFITSYSPLTSLPFLAILDFLGFILITS